MAGAAAACPTVIGSYIASRGAVPAASLRKTDISALHIVFFVNYFSNCKSVPQFLGGAVFLSTTMFHPDMKIPSTLNLIRDSSSAYLGVVHKLR